MKEMTICLLVKKTQGKITHVCLGMKKKGFGEGKWNGFGGKVGDHIVDETPEEAGIREVYEEAGVKVTRIKKAAELAFSNPNGSGDVVHSHVYLISHWDGEITESDEMHPQWFAVSEIPYKAMWSADRYWMPEVIKGHAITAEFFYDDQNQFNHKINIIRVNEFR